MGAEKWGQKNRVLNIFLPPFFCLFLFCNGCKRNTVCGDIDPVDGSQRANRKQSVRTTGSDGYDW